MLQSTLQKEINMQNIRRQHHHSHLNPKGLRVLLSI